MTTYHVDGQNDCANEIQFEVEHLPSIARRLFREREELKQAIAAIDEKLSAIAFKFVHELQARPSYSTPDGGEQALLCALTIDPNNKELKG
tara:strand:- start:34 stop:306 length:273 start_codon:yes stop_codon:yes gene_type:complete